MNPKILFIDLETAPTLGFAWGLHEQDILSIEKSWYILSASWRWGHEKKTRCLGLVDYPRYKAGSENDLALMKHVWELLNEADIVVAHNGDRFDLPRLNARFLFHGMKPPAPYKTIDTLKIARSKFKMDSNRLDAVARYLKIGKKLPHTGFDLWKGCMAGEAASWKLMKQYNVHDVVLLYEVYQKFLPWITNHPNYGVYLGTDSCPNCGNTHLQRRGTEPTKTGLKQRFQCARKANGNPGCGAWSYGKTDKVVDVR